MANEGQKTKKKKNDPDESKEATDIHTLEAEVNHVNNRFGTLEAEVHDLGATLKLFMQQFSG